MTMLDELFIKQQSLLELPLFKGFKETQLMQLLALLGATSHVYPRNQTIIGTTDKAKAVGILLEGTASVSRYGYNGERNILFHMQAPAMFGESLAILDAKEYGLQISALEDCTVLFLDDKKLLSAELPSEFRETLLSNLLHIMAVKNITFRQKIDIMSRKTTRDKLLTYLNLESKRLKARSFSIPYSRQELADYLGVERSALSAVIGQLVQEGILSTRRSSFTLL